MTYAHIGEEVGPAEAGAAAPREVLPVAAAATFSVDRTVAALLRLLLALAAA